MVPVVLSDIDRERNVLQNDVAPSDVLRETISASPALEASTIELIFHDNVLEKNVLNVCDCATFSKGANGQTVSTLAVVLFNVI